MEPDYIKLKEIKPALSGYIRESLSLLKLSSMPDEKTVHDIRVLMKKSRAAINLTASQLVPDSSVCDIQSLREVGRILRIWREKAVQRKILKETKKKHPVLFIALKDFEKLMMLLKKTETKLEPSEEENVELEKIRELLSKTGYRIRFQSMNTLDPQLLLKKLELTYAGVVDIYLRSRNNPKPVMLHEFRKKAKSFLYQLIFFRPLNPSVIKILEKNLDAMTQYLGKVNDLNQLVSELDYGNTENKYFPALDELILIIREQQDRYLSKTWPIAFKIFCPGQKLVNVLGFKILVI